jgi:hypothetical protein
MCPRNNFRIGRGVAALALLSGGCAHHSAASMSPSFVPLPTAQLPVVEHDHQVVAVGRYVLPLPVVLPTTLSPLPTATALFSNTNPYHPLLGVEFSFPDKDSKAFLAWAQTFPICVLHSGVVVWQSKHSMSLERRPAPATGYVYVPRPASQATVAWSIYGFFVTKDWLCSVTWKRGDVFIGRSVYPLPTEKNDLSISLGFMRQPVYVWLPLHEKDHRIVSVGKYRLPDPITLPAGIAPIPSALAVYRREPSLHLLGFKLFFPPKEEAAVFQWAKSNPAILPGAVGSWQPTKCFFWTKDKTVAGGVDFSEKVPTTPPPAWNFAGTLLTNHKSSHFSLSGVDVVSIADLKSNPAAQYLLSVGAADMVGGSDEFGDASLLKGEHRHVSLTVSISNIQSE